MSGASLPAGWTLKRSDRFGTGGNRTVTNYTQLHGLYNEGPFWTVDGNGIVQIPNVTINGEQQTYDHFEKAYVFASDHLTIQGRGHPDGSITSGEMVSKYANRNMCVEALYRIPGADKSWTAFWFYASGSGNDSVRN